MEKKRVFEGYAISYYQYNWHDGGVRTVSFVEGDSVKKAVEKKALKWYEWLKSFSAPFDAYIEDVRIYKVKLEDTGREKTFKISGPIAIIKDCFTSELANKLDQESFLNTVKEKLVKSDKNYQTLDEDVKYILWYWDTFKDRYVGPDES